MKTLKLFSIVIILFLTLKARSQAPQNTVAVTYTLDQNGYTVFEASLTSSNCATTSYTCYWDFGNGATYSNTSVTQTVSTTYTINGYYKYVLYVLSFNSACTTGAVGFVTVSSTACPLLASFSNSFSSSSPTVSFNNTSTNTVSTTSYTWNFGDGTTSNAVNPVHVYSGIGYYYYTLTARSGANCASFFGLQPQYGSGGFTVCGYTPSIVTSTGSAGAASFTLNNVDIGTASSFDFGDGSSVFSSSPFSHIYFNGTYTPSLQVSVNCSPNTATASVITVTDNPCYANSAFTYTAGSGGVVHFSKTSPPTGGNIAYFWTFGDGSASFLTNPTHTYSNAGNYSVTLVSYDATYSLTPGDTTYYNLPCKSVSKNNLNITGISCVANSGFSVNPYVEALHYYTATPDYPYNVSAAVWNWGDGNSSNQLYASHQYSTAGNYNICLTVTTSCGATSSTCFNNYLAKATGINEIISINIFPPQLGTGIEENENEKISMMLFPNPTSGDLNIKLAKTAEVKELAVYDLVGNIVYFETGISKEGTLKLDVSELSNGIYFLKLNLSRGTAISKFIISK